MTKDHRKVNPQGTQQELLGQTILLLADIAVLEDRESRRQAKKRSCYRPWSTHDAHLWGEG